MDEKLANAYVAKAFATRGQRAAVPSSLLTQPPDKYSSLVDPYDKTKDLT